MLRITVIVLAILALIVALGDAAASMQGKPIQLQPPTEKKPEKEARSTRVYQLPNGKKAETLAAFLKELKLPVMETEVQGNKLTVTTTPQTQDTVGQIVTLMQGRLHEAKLKGAKLSVSITGPKNTSKGERVTFQITVMNTSKVPLNDVILEAQLDATLEHETKASPLNLEVGKLRPQETRTAALMLTAVRSGQSKIVVTATSDGHKDRAEHIVVIKQP